MIGKWSRVNLFDYINAIASLKINIAFIKILQNLRPMYYLIVITLYYTHFNIFTSDSMRNGRFTVNMRLLGFYAIKFPGVRR